MACTGWSVLLLEKKALPRCKPCGGGLTQRALNLIPFDIQALIEDRATTACLRVHYRTAFSQTRPRPIVHLVMRDRLDQFLALQARAAGATLEESPRFLALSGPPGNLTLHTSGGDFRARLIAGADGVHSRAARALKLPIQFGLMPALETEVPVAPRILNRFAGSIHFDFGVVPGGYAWIFPKKNHLSVGILARRPKAQSLKPLLAGYLFQNNLPGETLPRSVRLHPIPCRPNRRNRYAEARGLILGDGTGLVDPVTGEGLFYALQSAAIAAGVLRRYGWHDHAFALRYNSAIKCQIESEILYADILARLLYTWPTFSNWVLKRFGAIIGTRHMAVYLGEMTYRQLFRYVMSPGGFAHLLGLRNTGE